MSDDLDRRLRESLSDLPLPSAPATLHAAIDRLETEPVAQRRMRGRDVIAALPVVVVAIAMVAAITGGSGPRLGAAPSTTPAASAAVSMQPAATPSLTSAPSATNASGGLQSTTTHNGLSLETTLSSSEVAPGGSITIDVVIRNDRSVPVVIGPGRCGAPATMYALLPLPLDPPGRDWDGIAATFKQYALNDGLREGGAPISAPGWVYATTTPCRDSASDITLGPGATMTGSMTWSGLLVQGVPALPGKVPFTISVSHDPTGGPPSYPSDYKGPLRMWFRTYEQLTVNGTIRIAGHTQPVLAAGQAIDSMLSDRRFVNWLSSEPSSTWSGANVFLQNNGKAEGIVPAGPSWDVELFREVGVPRNWAMGFVDPYSGKVLGLTFCNARCNR